MASEILFLAHRIPFPPDRGDKIRSWHMLRSLAARSRVHLGAFADDAADAAHLGALREALGEGLGETHVEVRRRRPLVSLGRALASGEPLSNAMFASAAMARFAQRISARPEIGTVLAFSAQMAAFVPPIAGKRFLMDFVDDDSAKYEAYAERGWGLGRWLFRREASRLLAFERSVAARADISFFVTAAEAELFRRRARIDADIRALGNGVDLEYFRPGAASPAPDTPRPLLVFTGQMDYSPNIEAVAGFVADCMPRLRASLPGLVFAIVGRNPVPKVRSLASTPGVLVTGGVPDVRPWLAAADAVVAPLRLARGIQNKVLEAMAMGRPVVASPAAFEGIEAVPGRDLIVVEDPVADLLALLADPARAEAIGAAARAQVERAYDWSARMQPLVDLAVEGRQQRAAA